MYQTEAIRNWLNANLFTDIVRAIRCEALSMIITPLDKDMSTRRIPGFSTACSGSQKFNSALGSAALCDAATLGGLTIHIDHRFTNLTTLPYIKESVVQVASGVFPKIGRIEVLPQHPQCSLHTKYATLGKKIHEDLPGLVARYIKPGHKKYMENQRNKTGIELSRAGQKQRQAITRRYW